MSSDCAKVVVVGAGFSGLLTAIQLLRRSPRVRVTLVERRAAFGPGTAYDTGNADHLLNVRLGNMSAFPDEPGHLSDWLARQPSWQASGQFITRGAFGAYLMQLLEEALADNPGRFDLVRGEAVALDRGEGEWRLSLAGGQALAADAVVLAVGNQEPATPVGVEAEVRRSPLYIENPWTANDLPDSARKVLLIGSGLTAVDVALTLERSGRTVTMMSRHGLLPRAHASVAASAVTARFAGSPAQVLGQVRGLARDQDWRDVMDALRAQAGSLWRDWDQFERLRFLRHLRPLWEVHRHRLAPAVARRVSGLIASGQLSVIPARLVALRLSGRGIKATYRLRRERGSSSRQFDAVVNCTGPLGRLAQSRDPLIVQLLRRRFVEPDPLGLGFHVGPDGRLVSTREESRSLFVVGPLSRGAFWEMTSVPDLRIQAQTVARQISDSLASDARPDRAVA